jgi:hypothetical protein
MTVPALQPPKRTSTCDEHVVYAPECDDCHTRVRTYFRFYRAYGFRPCRAARRCGTCTGLRQEVS